jgi:hypothetical protein
MNALNQFNTIMLPITEQIIDELEARKIIRQEFTTLITIHQSFYKARQIERANALLSDLNFYAKILGLNLPKVLGRNDINQFLFETDNRVSKPNKPFENPCNPFENPNNTVLNVPSIRVNTEFIQQSEFQRICPNCGRIIKGRKNKVYCNDSCRTNFNNQKALLSA